MTDPVGFGNQVTGLSGPNSEPVIFLKESSLTAGDKTHKEESEMRKHRLFTVVALATIFIAYAFVESTPLSAQTAPKPMTQKLLLGGRVEDACYAISQALAKFINTQSSWLRVEVATMPGIDSGPEIAMEDPEKYIYVMTHVAIKRMPQMEKFKKYNKMRIVGFCSTASTVWITYDNQIKTANDLIGKRVFAARPGGLLLPEQKDLLTHLGVWDKIKLAHGGYGSAATALTDGLSDVTLMTVDHIYPSTFTKGAFITQMETRKPIYYCNIMPPELQDKFSMIPARVPPGSLDAKTQPNELWSTLFPIFFSADERLDQDVVYEVTRILYENAGKFTSWHAQGASLTKEFIPLYYSGENWIHPGALKYYKEKSVTLKNITRLFR